MKLNEIKKGESFKILNIATTNKVKMRLNQMGIAENAVCDVVKLLPLGKNILLNIDNNLVGIRFSLAEKISGIKL